MIVLKTCKQIDSIRKSCNIVSYVLEELYKNIKPGITTKFLNDMAEELCLQKKGIPAFKGYKGFPFSLCTSKNEVVVHGFPDDVILKDGEILSIDFGVLYKGWYGDSAFTTCVGDVDDKDIDLIETTRLCLYEGIKAAIVGNRLGDIGYHIQNKAESNGYNVVKDFVGHGIGKNLHEEPQVLNYGSLHTGYELKSGMVIAIEPMLTVGSSDTEVLSDGWTTITKDRKLSAHWEHTIAITEEGPEILTIRN
jgi:methionyl aminopeptidase